MIGEQLHITADERKIEGFPKLACRRTSFIRKELGDTGLEKDRR